MSNPAITPMTDAELSRAFESASSMYASLYSQRGADDPMTIRAREDADRFMAELESRGL